MSEVIAELPSYIRPCGQGSWRVSVWVQPGAKNEGVTGEYQDSVRVRINAPAVDNKANKALAAFVAPVWVSKSEIFPLHQGIPTVKRFYWWSPMLNRAGEG